MPRFVPPLLAALLALFVSSARGQALNPFESFDENFKQLKDRIRFYSSNYSGVAIPDEMKPDRLAELAAQGGMSQVAVRKLRALMERLDRVVLSTVKREIYSTGQSVKGDPTSHSNYVVRSTLLLEFGAIVRRQKLHFASYFPKGDGYLQRLDAERIGRACVALGAGRNRVEDGIDPGVGIIVHVKPGDRVVRGQPVVELRHSAAPDLQTARALVEQAIEIGDRPPTIRPLVLERVAPSSVSPHR
jgi:hypothetical protein